MRRKGWRWTWTFLLLFLGIIAFISSAGATDYTYIGPDNGVWSLPDNWSSNPVVLNSYPNGSTDTARINDDPNTNVNVNLNVGPSLNRLQIDAGDSLTFGANNIFTLSGTDPTVINNGSITLPPSNSYFQLNGGITATFSGTGTLYMATGSSLQGQNVGFPTATYINDSSHTIRGAGWIVANMENRGNIIAEGGELHFHGNNPANEIHQSDAGTLSALGSGGLLTIGNNIQLYGGHVNPNDGEVRLDNVGVFNNTTFGAGKIVVGAYGQSLAFLNGDFTTAADFTVTRGATLTIFSGFNGSNESWITNTGKFLVESNGVTQLKSAYGTAVFTGTGSIVLGGIDSRLTQEGNGDFANDTNHTIRGAGTIDAPVYNAGTIIAENGRLIINQEIKRVPPEAGSYGPGQVIVKSGGTLDVGANVQTGDLIMEPDAILYVQNAKIIDLKGDFTFSQQNAGYWSWGAGSVLQMSGGGDLQRLEVGGTDYHGVSPPAFTNNFDLSALSLMGTGTQVYLADLIDNGHRASPEALYVEDLYIEAGATLFLNGINLYTINGQVNPGIWANGGGLVSASGVPIPGAVWLLGTGLLGLGLLGGRRKQG